MGYSHSFWYGRYQMALYTIRHNEVELYADCTAPEEMVSHKMRRALKDAIFMLQSCI